MRNTPDEEYILFALQQMKEAMEFGFSQNHCNRNLKVALGKHWEHPKFGFHTIGGKMRLPRSVAALGRERHEVVTEHAVPKQVIVNRLLQMRTPTKAGVRNLLEKLWRVTLVTKEEDERLRELGLRFRMPQGWDGVDPWARYEAADIKLTNEALQQFAKSSHC